MKKILLVGLLIIVLVLGLSVGLFISKIDRSGDYDNRDKLSGNVIKEVESEPIEGCDSIDILVDEKESNTILAAYCLDRIKNENSDYEECEVKDTRRTGETEYRVSCKCCYNY